MKHLESIGAKDRWTDHSVNPDNLFELGLRHATGRGGKADPVLAHKWFNLAAYRGCEAAKAHREQLAAEMTAVQIAAAQRAAREWMTSRQPQMA